MARTDGCRVEQATSGVVVGKNRQKVHALTFTTLILFGYVLHLFSAQMQVRELFLLRGTLNYDSASFLEYHEME